MPRISKSKAAIERRTRGMLATVRGKHDEFSRLQGILCMDHGFTTDEAIAFRAWVDLMKVAERMDELQHETIAAYHASKKAG